MMTVSPRRSRGQELIEYALTLPLLVLLLFVILDLGRLVYYYSALQNAVREGARWGIIRPGDTAGVETIVRDRALGLEPAGLTRVEITYNNDEKTLKVRFRYGFAPVTPLVGELLGLLDEDDRIVITASSTMHQEY